MKNLIIAGLISGILSGCSIDETTVLPYKCAGEWHEGTCLGNLVADSEIKFKVKNGIIEAYYPKSGTAIYLKDCAIMDVDSWKCEYYSKNKDNVPYAYSYTEMSHDHYHSGSICLICYTTNLDFSQYGISGWKYWAYKAGVGLKTLHNIKF